MRIYFDNIVALMNRQRTLFTVRLFCANPIDRKQPGRGLQLKKRPPSPLLDPNPSDPNLKNKKWRIRNWLAGLAKIKNAR